MIGRQKAKPVLVAWLVLAWLSHAAADGTNYCHDPQANQEWGRLIEEAPGDDLLMRLFALRLGLCQLVDSGQLDQGCSMLTKSLNIISLNDGAT
jgi:hypothetical protein